MHDDRKYTRQDLIRIACNAMTARGIVPDFSPAVMLDLATGSVRIRVAIADVDARVVRGSAIDQHACVNTTSVNTSARVFPMLPERLANDLTSLTCDQDRLALVTEMVVDANGIIAESDVR